jgi:hypothetical protein
VKDHGRKYGEKDSHPIPLWNGLFEHYDRIGGALWEFTWCIDRVTEECDGVGLVLGGAPVKIPTIVADLKGSRRETVRRHMDDLESENYIRRRRTPYGHVIEVLNSRKFGIWKKEKPQIDASFPLKKPTYGQEKPTGGSQKPKNSTNKEDSAVTQQEDAAVATAPVPNSPNPWKLLESDLPMGSPGFQGIFGHFAATRNGNSLSDAMERTIQLANKRGIKVPPPFFDAKRVVEQREAYELARSVENERPELEELPWAK